MRNFRVKGLAPFIVFCVLTAPATAWSQGKAELGFGTPVHERPSDPRWIICFTADTKTRIKYVGSIIEATVADTVPYPSERWDEFIKSKYNISSDVIRSCNVEKSAEDAQWRYDDFNTPGNKNYQVVNVDWTLPPAKSEAKKENGNQEQGNLKTLTLLWPAIDGSHVNGYYQAEIDLKYRFIACMGEVHVAYSLDPDSVRTGANYAYNRSSVPGGNAAPPRVESVAFTAQLFERGVGGASRIGWVSDQFAGPALGFGCFTGQSKKVGTVKQFAGADATPAEIDALLNERLFLDVGRVDTRERLRNSKIEASAKTAADERYEREKAAYDKAIREREEAIAKYEADMQAMKDQQARNAELTRQAQDEFARKQAEYEAEVRRSEEAQADYERRMRELGYDPQH